MLNFKYAQKKLSAESTDVYSNNDHGLVPTSAKVIEKSFGEYFGIFNNISEGSMYLRPLSFEWTKFFPDPTSVLLGGRVRLFNRTAKRKVLNRYGMNIMIKDMQDEQEIQNAYKKTTGKSLRNSTIAEIREYVRNHLNIEWLKCFYGNPPFGGASKSQGQYICWPIMKLALAMLDPGDGIAAVIIPSSIFKIAGQSLTSLREEIIPFIEYIDMDVNQYFRESGNEPGIKMSSVVINFAKKDDIIKVKLNGVVHNIKNTNNELVYLLNPEKEVVDSVKSVTENLTKLKDIFICDIKQTSGGSDDIPVSQGKMIRTNYASKEFNIEKDHTEPFYYSCVKMYTSRENIKNHYNKTSGVLSMKMNYSGYHTLPGCEEYYMPTDTYPIGKCAEGIPVDSLNEGELVRKCYTRKLPVFISENNKGNNAYNGAIYFLPWIERSKYEEITDSDWYELADLSTEQIKIVEDWYEEWHNKHAKK